MKRTIIAISFVIAAGLLTGCNERPASAQQKADDWCRKANHDSGARYYGNPQYLCAAADGTWARFQPDGQLVSDGGSTFLSPLGVLDMSEDVRAANNWCAKANEDPDDGMVASAYVPDGGKYDDKTGKCVDSNGKPVYWQPEKPLLDAKDKIIPPFNAQMMFPSSVTAVGDPAVPKPVTPFDKAEAWCQNANSNPKAIYDDTHDHCVASDGNLNYKRLRYQPSDPLLNSRRWDGDTAKPVDCGNKKSLSYVEKETTCSEY